MNWPAIYAVYRFEMARTWRTLMQSIIAPVISTSLYFVVFGTAIGSRIQEVGDVSYGAFIVPGLITRVRQLKFQPVDFMECFFRTLHYRLA